MERVTPKLMVGWLIGAIALAFGVVGCGTITHHDPLPQAKLSGKVRGGPVVTGLLERCTMTDGRAGLQFDALCLPAPPAGWTGPNMRIKLQPTSFLTLPSGRECQTDTSGQSEFLAV